MKLQFSKTEKAAGFFVLIAMGSFAFISFIVAYKQGWFSTRYYYRTTFTHGDGLHPGTQVLIAGLKAGTVQAVGLNDKNEIEVRLSVTHDFSKRIKEDSVARVVRPFVIGDKVVDISVGGSESPLLREESSIRSEDTMDLMDLLGGGKLGPYLATLDGLLRNLQVVVEAFTDPRRSKALIGMFDELLPTMQGVRELSAQATRNKNLDKSMRNIADLTKQLNEMDLPQLGAQFERVTVEMNKLLPQLTAVAPQLPEASQRSLETLKEAVVVLRAMQKSFLLRGAVKDVQEEDALAAKKAKDSKDSKESETPPNRTPASQ